MNKKPVETLDLRQFFPYRLSVLQQRVSTAISRHYRDEFDLNRIEWRVMATLAMLDSISAREICEFTRMEKMQVSRAIARLKKHKLVIQKINETDHRATQLSLTAEGWKIYRKIVPRVKSEEQQILDHLSASEQGQLLKILAKLEDYGTAVSEPVDLDEGEIREDLVIQFQVPGSCSGTLTTPSGKPVAEGYAVAARWPEGFYPSDFAQTGPDASGAYRIDALQPGSYDAELHSTKDRSRAFNASNAIDRKPISIISGEEVTGVNFIVPDKEGLTAHARSVTIRS